MAALASLAGVCQGCGCGEDDRAEPFGPIGTGSVGVTEQDWFLAFVSLPGEEVGFDLDGEWTRCGSGCINDGKGGVDNRLGAVKDGIAESVGNECDGFFMCDPQHPVDTGSLSMLIKTRRGTDDEGRAVLEAYVYNGVDTDGDPSDNVSGVEPFEVTRDSVNGSGVDPLGDAAYRFDQGGRVDENGYWFEPIRVMIVRSSIVRPPPAC